MSGPGSPVEPYPEVTWKRIAVWAEPEHMRQTHHFVTYNDFESVQQRGSVSQAAKLKAAGVVFWNVSISSCTQEDFLYVAKKGVTQVLHWIHHHSAINSISWQTRHWVLIKTWNHLRANFYFFYYFWEGLLVKYMYSIFKASKLIIKNILSLWEI